jgi:glycerol-3-phosphate dehydrogenase
MTAAEQTAILLNYVEVTGLSKNSAGTVTGVIARDVESGQEFHAEAKVVINATGAFADRLRTAADSTAAPMIAPSQGIHLVFGPEFLARESAIMVPHTSDGRVLFAIPWHGRTLVGTTDTPVDSATLEPAAHDEEIEFILETAGQYLAKAPTRADVLSVFAGIRPLIGSSGTRGTAALSRDHVIHIERSGLVSVMGGKWTTYRLMAEDCVDQAAKVARLPDRPCVTEKLPIHGYQGGVFDGTEHFGMLSVYGSDATEIRKLIASDEGLGERLDPALPYLRAEVVWAARQEMARTLEDVLARRTRALFLNARAAIEMAPVVAELMAQELGWNNAAKVNQCEAIYKVASTYQIQRQSFENERRTHEQPNSGFRHLSTRQKVE